MTFNFDQVKLSGELRDKHQSADQQWMKTVFSGGTTNDKVISCILVLCTKNSMSCRLDSEDVMLRKD